MEISDELIEQIGKSLGPDSSRYFWQNVDSESAEHLSSEGSSASYDLKQSMGFILDLKSYPLAGGQIAGEGLNALPSYYGLSRMFSLKSVRSPFRLIFTFLIFLFILAFISIIAFLLVPITKDLTIHNLFLRIAFILALFSGLAIIFLWIFYRRLTLIETNSEKLDRQLKVTSVKKAAKKDDKVYTVINNTFNNLERFRNERLRQAKMSFNAALGLIIIGILIVFIGVFLLFKKSITEGALTAALGVISNIIGGTILKFYQNTNDRLDRIDNDLFILDTAKVQYALILNINEKTNKDQAIKELIGKIGEIKRPPR
jgi:hypothetical protein